MRKLPVQIRQAGILLASVRNRHGAFVRASGSCENRTIKIHSSSRAGRDSNVLRRLSSRV